MWLPIFLALEADAHAKVGHSVTALQVIEEAIQISEETGERWAIAEVLRIKASLLLATGRPTEEVEALTAAPPPTSCERWSHLAGQPGAELSVTLEIDARLPNGASEQTVRTVSENSRTLKFTSRCRRPAGAVACPKLPSRTSGGEIEGLGGPLPLVGSRSPAPAAQPSRSASRPFGCRSLPRSPLHTRTARGAVVRAARALDTTTHHQRTSRPPPMR